MSALAGVMQAMRKLSKVPSQVAKDGSVAIRKLMVDQFRAGTDAYGRAWAPLRPATLDKGRSPPPLTDSGVMANVVARPSSGAGITITLGADYSRYHQTGTSRMVARPIFPDRQLPATWVRALSDAADRAFERSFK